MILKKLNCILLFFLASKLISACDCYIPIGDEGFYFYKSIKYSFVGKVLNVGTTENGTRFYEVEILRTFKGKFKNKVTIFDMPVRDRCAVNLEKGRTYLLNPSREKQKLLIEACGFNRADTAATFYADTLFMNQFGQKNGYVDLPEFKGNMKNGKPDGEWKYYRKAANGVMTFTEIVHFKNGNLDGEDTEYTNDGSIYTRSTFKRGREKQMTEFLDDSTYYVWDTHFLSNKIILYNTSGKILVNAQKTLFKNEVIDYYANGKIKGKGKFRRGLEISGNWNEYDQQGKLITTKNISVDETFDIYEFLEIRDDLYLPKKED